MGDITSVANLLIGKVEEYGQLLGSKAFPLFVQRQILWGHVNRTLGWVSVGMFVLSIILVLIGTFTDRSESNEFYFITATCLFIASIPMAIGSFVTSALQLNSPEFEAIKAIIGLIIRGNAIK